METIEIEPPGVEEIRARHDRLLTRLREVAGARGHDPAALRIVAVTKGHPLSMARAAAAAGLERLGESRVQEAEPKIEALPMVEWHFIGHLQSNKARRAVRAFPVIHSVHSTELLKRVDALAAEEGRAPEVLLQVNVRGEASKSGMAPADLDAVRVPTTARLVGLMTIAPMDASEDEAGRIFGRLRELRDRLGQRLGLALPELSMGMSGDAEAAAAEGATLVRVGTALFGPRG